MLTLHLGRDGWVRLLGEAAENFPQSTPGAALGFSIGDAAPARNQVESHPSQEDRPSPQVFQSPSGWLKQAEGGRAGNPRGWVRVHPGTCVSGQDHRLQPGGRPPRGPGAPLTRPDSTQLVSMTRVWLC